MNTRVVGAIAAFAVVGLGLLLGISVMFPEWAARMRPLIIGAGAVISLLCLVLCVGLVMAHSGRAARQEAAAEAAFERNLLQEPPSDPLPPPVEVTPAPAASSVSRKSTTVPLTIATGLEGLLTQLRLARLEPQTEGEHRDGPFAGATVVRLNRTEMALVLKEVPREDHWAALFPRYDRVFFPQGDRWLVVERLEGLVRRGIEMH